MPTLWLIGMMGSGKTTVGRVVAQRLGADAIDIDAEVVIRSGRSIEEWFASDPQGFRSEERVAVLECAGRDAVVSCGGGVVLDDGVVATMRDTGLVVWLDAPIATLAARVGAGEGRPLLSGEGSLAVIAEERAERYRTAAHVTVAAAGPPDEVAEAVIAAWTSWS